MLPRNLKSLIFNLHSNNLGRNVENLKYFGEAIK